MRSAPRRENRHAGDLPAAVRTCALAFVIALAFGCSPQPSSVTLIAPPGAPGSLARDPSIALDPASDDVLLTWLAGDSVAWRVWYARSADNGTTWSEPIAVSPPGEPLEPQDESTPRLACDARGRVAILWATGSEPVNGERPASELRFVSSLDGGKSWSLPVTLQEGPAAIPLTERFHDIAATDEGKLVAAWLANPALGDPSHRASGAGASVEYSVSTDFGAHWGPVSAEWSQVCPCGRVAVTGAGFTAFRRHYEDGACDVAIARPGGPSVRAFRDGWNAEECPRSGPGLGFARDGTLRLAWFTGAPGRSGVWFRQGLPELYDTTVTPLLLLATANAAPPLHVSVGDAGMSGTLIACDGDSLAAGPLTLFRVEASGRRLAERIPVAGPRDAVRPQVAASNKRRIAFVAWTERDGTARRLRLLRWHVGR